MARFGMRIFYSNTVSYLVAESVVLLLGRPLPVPGNLCETPEIRAGSRRAGTELAAIRKKK